MKAALTLAAVVPFVAAQAPLWGQCGVRFWFFAKLLEERKLIDLRGYI